MGGPRNNYRHGRGSVVMPNFDNARKLVQKELESECVCPNSCYSQFPEDEMSIAND